jgi:transcription antitermination protein NusB
MLSRRRSREFLLQSLYSRTELKSSFDRSTFIASYFDEGGVEMLEMDYIDSMEKMILTHEDTLIGIIALLAPKFELPTIPVMHILILMIALTEILYRPDLAIPEAVTVNEAIELAKRFSDDQGRMFIN